jgi:hypothetical protein
MQGVRQVAHFECNQIPTSVRSVVERTTDLMQIHSHPFPSFLPSFHKKRAIPRTSIDKGGSPSSETERHNHKSMARSLSGSSGPDARSDACFRDALEKYNNGSHGVDGIVRLARDYKGPCVHAPAVGSRSDGMGRSRVRVRSLRRPHRGPNGRARSGLDRAKSQLPDPPSVGPYCARVPQVVLERCLERPELPGLEGPVTAASRKFYLPPGVAPPGGSRDDSPHGAPEVEKCPESIHPAPPCLPQEVGGSRTDSSSS